VIWVAGGGGLLLFVLMVLGLVDLMRQRHTMERWQIVVWAAVLVLLPVVGLVGYLFWRIARSESMRGAIDFQDEHSGKSESYPPIGR
jgi:hypothetical protein